MLRPCSRAALFVVSFTTPCCSRAAQLMTTLTAWRSSITSILLLAESFFHLSCHYNRIVSGGLRLHGGQASTSIFVGR